MGTSSPPSGFPPDKTVTYTNWGRSALQTAFEIDDLVGKSVIMPAFIEQRGLQYLFERLEITPLFVDIDPQSFRMKLESAKQQVSEADAVLLVHPFGLPADVDAWVDLCDDSGLVLIEDCVRALGATHNGQVVGSFGKHAVYALHKVSPVFIGGAIATDAANAHEFLSPPKYNTHALYHLFPDNIQQELSITYPLEYECRQLDDITRRRFELFLSERFDEYRQANREKSELVREKLEPLEFQFQPNTPNRTHFLAPAIVPPEVVRDDLVNYLYANLKQSHVKVVWSTPWAKSRQSTTYAEAFPNTAHVASNIVCFTIRNMTEQNISSTVETIEEYITAHT